MAIKSLDELRTADERTLKFNSLGLGGKLAPEEAARFQQEVISTPHLAAEVSGRVAECFARLCTIHSYGVLCYDMFTVAYDQAQLALEFALRERFSEFHADGVELKDKNDKTHLIPLAPFRGLQVEIKKHEEDEWRLVIRRNGRDIRFDGMLDSLLRWAYEEGLLRGQRNRARNPTLRNMRDHIAHGAGDHLLMPVDSARAIRDVAEIINQLWGVATPGGRLYPAPIRREINLLGWAVGGDVTSGQIDISNDAQALNSNTIKDLERTVLKGRPAKDWTWVLVRAVPHDNGLMRFDSLFEVTDHPCDLLTGPASIEKVVSWGARELPDGDKVEALDRLFLVQFDKDRVYLPRRPEIALGTADCERGGTWSLIRADSPSEAFAHGRNIAVKGSGCSRKGECSQCAATTIRRGSWADVAAVLATELPHCQTLRVADARVTSPLRWPRYQQVVDNGDWALGDE